MDSGDSIGIIELGNPKIKCLVFRIDNNKAEILSTSVTSSEGIHNDTIVNLTKATNAIRSCISKAEEKAKILNKEAHREAYMNRIKFVSMFYKHSNDEKFPYDASDLAQYMLN